MHEKPSYKELEQRLQDVEHHCRYFKSIIDNTTDFVSKHDPEGIFTYASPAAFDLTGYAPEELIGRSAYDFFHPDDMDAIHQSHQEIQKIPVISTIAYRFRHKQGHYVWLETTSKTIHNPLSGQIEALIATTRNVAARIEAEDKLARRLAFERLISDISSKFLILGAEEIDQGLEQALAAIGQLMGADRTYIFLYREDQTVADSTHAWCAKGMEPQSDHPQAMLPAGELPWFSSRLHRHEVFMIPDVSDLPPEARAERGHFQAQGILSLVAVPMVLGDRRLGFLELDAVSARRTWSDEERAVLRFFGELFSNTIERRRAESRLRESEQRWQFALEGAGDGVWDWNAMTKRVYFSKKWKTILGFDEDEIGDGLDEWERRVHPDDMDAVRADLNRHLRGQTAVYQNEHRMRCKDGTYKWILDRGKVVEWTAEGKPKRIIGTHSDVSDRKIAETEREKLIGELQSALARVKRLSGLLPICSVCKRIRDDQGYWNQIESYIRDHSEAEFSHSICAECAKTHYPGIDLHFDK